MRIKKLITVFRQRLKTNKNIKQSLTLMLWNFLSLPLTIVTNIVITRYMGAASYGDYLYVQRVFDFVYIILGFGVLQSINRAVLLAKDKGEQEIREYYGSGYLCLLLIYAIICVSLYAFTFISPNIREKGLVEIMLCVIPFCLVNYTATYFEQVLPASNRINDLIIQRYIPRIGLFVLSLVLYIVLKKVEWDVSPLVVVWSIFWGTQILTYLYVFKRIKPSFANAKSKIRDIIKIDKEFGIQVYFGNIFSTAFTALMPIFLSYFGEDNAGVGFYSLSLMLSQPLSFIPVVVATSHYQKFADYKSIPRKLMTMTFLISCAAMVFLWIIVTPFIKFFYTPEFSPVIYLTIISSVGTLLYGISDFFSRYLMAQGKGKPLRNSSFIVGFITLAMSVALIPWIHETGAAITHVAAGLVYFFIIVFYYRKCAKENTNRDKETTRTNI